MNTALWLLAAAACANAGIAFVMLIASLEALGPWRILIAINGFVGLCILAAVCLKWASEA